MAEKERGVGGSTLGAVQGVAMVVVAPLGLVFMEVAGEDVDEGRSPAAASGAWFRQWRETWIIQICVCMLGRAYSKYAII